MNMSDGNNKTPQTARDRLAQISHHFLSSDEEMSDEKRTEQTPKKDVYTLALLNTANEGDELPVALLSQQLAMHGRSSAVFDCTAGMNMVSVTSANDSQQTRTVHHNLEDVVTRRLDDKPDDVHFLLVDTTRSSHLSLADKVLITAPATPEGLQQAYISIKQLVAHQNTVQVGVIITGTSDVTSAEVSFNRLATAVHRFLRRDLLSYGYLSAASDISEQIKAPHPAPTTLTRPGIEIIAEIISDEIGEWKQNNNRHSRQKTQPINPASTNVEMSLNIKSVTITSDEKLLELVTDALPEILGNSYELVSNDLPFDGNHILALNAKKQPFVISCDKHDGERALQSGLSVLEGLSENRAIFQRLYPNVFNSHDQLQSRIEDTQLVVLSPIPPAGGAYLRHAHSYLSFYTFHALQIDNRTGLFIEPCFTRIDNAVQPRDSISDKIAHTFRGGKKVLSQEETAYFEIA